MSGTKLVIAGVAGTYAVYLARRFGQFKAAGLFTPSKVPIAPKRPDTLPAQIGFTIAHSFPFGSFKLAPAEPAPATSSHIAPVLGPINWEVSPVENQG